VKDFALLSPRRLDLPDGWKWIKERYESLRPAPQLDEVFKCVHGRATHALFEHEYIDADYRNEYANFYVKIYERLPDRCERLHFWQDATYLGYCSIRPITGAPVGRTAIAPPESRAIACLAKDTAHPYGRDLEVKAFPFISQDRRYGRCAHAVIWMISRYYHLRFGEGRFQMSDIVDGASSHEFERVVPSTGLTTEQIGAAFRHVHLAALHYDLGKIDDRQRALIITSYLNSGMPLALGTPGHLTALIGGGFDEKGFFGMCSDDEIGPYCKKRVGTKGKNDEWETLFVPLPERIYLRAEEAHEVGVVQYRNLLEHNEAQATKELLQDKHIGFRCFAVEAREHKKRIATRTEHIPKAVLAEHLTVGTPRWLWIMEIVDRDAEQHGEDGVLGELAIDATSGEHAARLLFAHLPLLRVRWPTNAPPTIAADTAPWRPYDSASALKLFATG
jgi:hypothetical protein